MFKLNLGDEVQDVITKFKGIIRARGDYLTGCNRYGVQSQKLKVGDTTTPDWCWFDEEQLKLLKEKKVIFDDLTMVKRKKGGPNSKDQFPPQ